MTKIFFVFLFFATFQFKFISSKISTRLSPPLGWNSWNNFGCNISEKLIEEIADAMVSSGLAGKGYEYINIDDCWQAPSRDSNGRLVPDPQKFPSGMASLAKYVKSKGLKLGIYSDVGLLTCAGRLGSYGHYDIDAQTFSDWGIEYLKLDFCNLELDEYIEPNYYYGLMSTALNKTSSEIFFSVCNWGWLAPYLWAPRIANSWRISLDIFPWYQRVLEILDDSKDLYPYSYPSAFNDPDMLEVGVNGTFLNFPDFPKCSLTEKEARSHFALWSLLRAPLLLGNDIRNMPKWVFNIIGNEEVIAVNQDPLPLQGRMIASFQKGIISGICMESICTHTETWSKKLSNNSFAVVLFNRADSFEESSPYYQTESIKVTWKELGISDTTKLLVRDLWNHLNFGIYTTSFSATVSPHDTVIIKLSPVQ